MSSFPYRQPESLTDTVESVANKIAAVKANKGQIDINGVPVRFNLQDGDASIVSVAVGAVNNEFNFPNQGILPMAKSAISLIAKHELLSQLQMVNDKQPVSEAEIDKTLAKIQHGGGMTFFSKPTPAQRAVTKAIGGKPIDCLDRVERVMQELSKITQKPQSTL